MSDTISNFVTTSKPLARFGASRSDQVLLQELNGVLECLFSVPSDSRIAVITTNKEAVF